MNSEIIQIRLNNIPPEHYQPTNAAIRILNVTGSIGGFDENQLPEHNGCQRHRIWAGRVDKTQIQNNTISLEFDLYVRPNGPSLPGYPKLVSGPLENDTVIINL